MIRSQASFTREIAGAKQRNGRFLTLFRDHTQPNLALLNVKDGVGTFSLGEDGLLRAKVKNGPADARAGQKGLRIKTLHQFPDTALCRYAATRWHKKLQLPVRLFLLGYCATVSYDTAKQNPES